MSRHMQSEPQQRQEMTGIERLSLRVSSMINHPLAQTQRWVVVHRLDNDGEAEWEEVMGQLRETPELQLTFNDDAAGRGGGSFLNFSKSPPVRAGFGLDQVGIPHQEDPGLYVGLFPTNHAIFVPRVVGDHFEVVLVRDL